MKPNLTEIKSKLISELHDFIINNEENRKYLSENDLSENDINDIKQQLKFEIDRINEISSFEDLRKYANKWMHYKPKTLGERTHETN